MNPNAQAQMPFHWRGFITCVKCVLDLDSCLNGRERAGEFEQKAIAGCFDFPSAVQWYDAADNAPMFLQQFQRGGLIALSQRTVAHHVREHDGGELALFGGFVKHDWIE